MSKALRRALLVVTMLCALCAMLPAQNTGESGLDSLFNNTDTPAATAPPANAPVQDQNPPVSSLRPDDLTKDRNLHYFGSLDIYGLVGIGWTALPGPHELQSGFGHEENGTLRANLGVDIRPADELRLSATMTYQFPRTGTQLSELIVDYTLSNSVFFRLGIFNYTWGTAQFFQFSNLPSRSLPDWGINNNPLWQQINIILNTAPTVLPVSMKVDIPIGLGNLTLLTRFDLQNYGFPDPNAPSPVDAGYGIRFDLVTGPIEWSLAGFYQRLLTPRGSLGLKTSVLGFDFSLESTVALPVTFGLGYPQWDPYAGGGIPVGAADHRIYPTVVAGLSREWVDSHVKLIIEYAFNGERDPGISWLADELGPGGHNSAVVARFAKLFDSDLSLNVLWQQNWSDGSGLVSPLIEFSPAHLATLQLGPVLVFGNINSEVMANRLVPGDKQLEFLILLKISTSFRQ